MTKVNLLNDDAVLANVPAGDLRAVGDNDAALALMSALASFVEPTVADVFGVRRGDRYMVNADELV